MNETLTPTDWAKASGDVWARRWRDTDRGLEPLQAHLAAAIAERARAGPFKAFDIGCGPGSTTIEVAKRFPEASIIACDISEALADVARDRTGENGRVAVVVGDAEAVAPRQAPTDLFFSRHGVMFFPDPVRGFRALRNAASDGAGLVFSCFQDLALNPWASELADAAAGRPIPPPGRESGGFAFADPNYVLELLDAAGWQDTERKAVPFDYVMGEGGDAVDAALSFMTEIGPASRIVESLPERERNLAIERICCVIEGRFTGGAVVFPAAAWVWSATA